MDKPVPLFLSLIMLSAAMTVCTCSMFTMMPAPEDSSLGDTRTRPADGMVMVYVPSGEFQMGSTDEEVDDALELCDEYYSYGDCERDWFGIEQPAHTVVLDGFWIDRTEVTNAQFEAFLSEEGVPFRPRGDYADHPAIHVTWYDAAAYCKWAGARLPTEAQWEYAARGPEGHIFPWGDELDGTRLNYGSCADTAPVGSYPEGASWCGALDLAGSVCGALDLAGIVWEWVADWYGDYPSGRQENPAGPSTGYARVMRGGGLRAADRNFEAPGYHGNTGFRCVSLPGE